MIDEVSFPTLNSAPTHPSGLISAVLEADPHAVFLIDGQLSVLGSNAPARRLLMAADLVQRDGGRLKGRRNAFHDQLTRAVRAVLQGESRSGGEGEAAAVRFRAATEPRFSLELKALGVPGAPPLLMRVYDGFLGPDTADMRAVEPIKRPPNPIHRRLSADGHHGPEQGAPRPPPPPWLAVRSFEAVARLGTMTLAAVELQTDSKAVSRHVKALEDWTRRPLRRGPHNHQRLTPAGRRLALALTAALDIIEAAAKPSPPGGKRGPRPKPQADAQAAGVEGKRPATEAPR